MRILFSTVPAYGHLLPVLPLVAAARRAGHDVALLTHPSMRDAAPSVPQLYAGPDVAETLAASGQGSPAGPAAPERAVALFVDARMELGAQEALAVVHEFGPELVVADMIDVVGRFAATALGVPWVAHGNAVVLPEPLRAALEPAVSARFRQLGVHGTRPACFVDPWPRSLLRPTDVFPAERIPIRPEPHAGEGPPWARPSFPDREGRPLVLVTLGTVVDAPDVVAAMLESLAGLDVNVLVAPVGPTDLEVDPARVHLAGFVPMRDLQKDVDVVVAAGGAGTVLSSLSAGLPMVLLPMGLDKPDNAARAAAVGAAQVIAAPEEVGAAVEKVLADPSTAAAARAVAAEIAAMNPPDVALELVLDRAGRGRR